MAGHDASRACCTECGALLAAKSTASTATECAIVGAGVSGWLFDLSFSMKFKSIK